MYPENPEETQIIVGSMNPMSWLAEPTKSTPYIIIIIQ